METVADIIIILFWGAFFIATLVLLIGQAMGKFPVKETEIPEDVSELEDDDPVFIFEPSREES